MDQVIEMSKALLTPVVAAVAAYVAWQQLTTNRRKLRLDLFDRRYAVFEKIGDFIGSILTTGRVQQGKEIQFLVDTKAVSFLFGEDISEFVSEIYRKAVDLHALDAELEGATGEARSANIKAQREIKDWYSKALRELKARFSGYLKLEH